MLKCFVKMYLELYNIFSLANILFEKYITFTLYKHIISVDIPYSNKY